MRQLLFISLMLLPFFGQAQEQFILSLDEFQLVECPNTSTQSHMRFPMSEKIIVMGGLNSLDGLGNYFNVYGSKLKVDSLNRSIDGVHKVTFRREDGQNFYGLFPTVSAKLIPVTNSEITALETE